ncbi:MAG: phosphotransferase [Sedimentisphaerales bacterium]
MSITEVDDVVISAESLSEGAFLKTEDLTSNVISKLLRDLKEMYINNISRQPFDLKQEFGKYDYLFAYYPSSWKDAVSQIQTKIKKIILCTPPDGQICKTLIHGDLTSRNILKSNGNITYVDFDRSEISYPEIDFYLFCVDLETHRDGQSTYELLFNNIFKLMDGRLTLIDEIDYYKIFPDFGANKSLIKEIKLLFLYRTLVLTLQYYTNTTNVPRRIFAQVNKGLDKYI